MDGRAAGSGGCRLLYDPNGTLISRLTGSKTDDLVGFDGVVLLANGNFIVHSPFWDSDTGAFDVGAVSFGNATTGFGGAQAIVNATNSLVGTQTNDRVGSPQTLALPNGHYVVVSDHWNRGQLQAAGAVTWGNGITGTFGEVSAANSLVGSSAGDHVGLHATVLGNGNYVVASPFWDAGAVQDVGAVTLRPSDAALPAEVSVNNSIFGSTAQDNVGDDVVVLSNNNFLVVSPFWDRNGIQDAGAVSWVSGNFPMTAGPITEQTAMVGSTAGDHLGWGGAIALANGHYAVASPNWDRGTIVDAGAVAWGNGASGSQGPLDVTVAMVGSKAQDQVGSGGLVALDNGNFIALSPRWDDGQGIDLGAASWLSGSGASIGPLNGIAALRGSFANDLLYAVVVPLSDGAYVVNTPNARRSNAVEAGAVTWCPGNAPCSRMIDAGNSLMGSKSSDNVGLNGVFPLPDGSYVVASSLVDVASHTNVGAVTRCAAGGTTAGAVSAANSMLGRSNEDQVGLFGAVVLPNGDFLALSPAAWMAPAGERAGAITRVRAQESLPAHVDENNSMFGSNPGDNIGLTNQIRVTGAGAIIATFPNVTDDSGLLNNRLGAVSLLDPGFLVGEMDPDRTILGAPPKAGPA
jgi:hypothetical protein